MRLGRLPIVLILTFAVAFAVGVVRLFNLRFATADIRREADGRTWHGIVRFRAVTEPE